MSREFWILGIVGAYLALSLTVGWRSGKGTSDSATGYVAGDRSMGPLLMYFVTGATIFSAFAFLGMPGRAYSTGGAAFYVLSFGTLGFLPFYWVGPRAAKLGREKGYITQGELVAGELSMRWIAPVMAFVAVIAFVPYLALQMRGAGIVLNVLTSGSVAVEAGAAVVYSIVLAYVWRSGVMGVGWTNTLQGVFMMLLAWALGLYLPHALHGGVAPMFESLDPEFLRAPGVKNGEPWTWAMYGSTIFVMAVGFSFWPHLFQKAFAARSGKVLRRTVVLYPTFQFFLLPILLIGFAGIGFDPPPDRPDAILPHMLVNMELPAAIVGLFCAGALAASMSSGDAILHSCASIVVRDAWITGAGREMSPSAERTAVRWMLFPIVVGGYLVATVVEEKDLVGLLTHAYGPVGQLAPPVIAALFWKRATGAGALAGLLVGSIVVIGAGDAWEALMADPSSTEPAPKLPVHAGLPALALNALTLVGVSLAGKRRG